MIPGQTDIDETLADSEPCDECPDPASCQAEDCCLAELGQGAPEGGWDEP
jgi:hypothetical protein